MPRSVRALGCTRLTEPAVFLIPCANAQLPPLAVVVVAMTNDTAYEPRTVWLYYGLACAITWVAALPAASAWIHHEQPGPGAVALAGLSALGPLIAAFVLSVREGQLGAVFGRWRTPLVWPVLALLLPLALRVLAAAFTALVGGELSRWTYPPGAPEQVAALFVLPVGEELGWRGFAYPRLAQRYGLVRGSILLGLMWGFWHLTYSITPTAHGFDWFVFLQGMLECPLYALIGSWLFEKGRRSMTVALVFHAAAHVDHIELAPHSELTLHASHLGLVALAALVAARQLRRLPAPPLALVSSEAPHGAIA